MNRLLVIASALLATASAHAQVTYDYTGGALIGGAVGTGDYIVPGSLTGDIVLASALNPNEANQVVTPLSFNFTSQYNLLSSYPSMEAVGISAEFTTVNGNITAWNVGLSGWTPGTDTQVTLNESITTLGDNYSAQVYGPGCQAQQFGYDLNDNCYSVTEQNNVKGSWVDPPGVSAVSVPEISGSGFLDAMTFLFCAIMVLTARFHGKIRKDQSCGL